MMNYIAIDFETATGSMNSACSVATVEVRDGQLKEGWSTLIQPPGLRFDSFNIGIHGISPKDVADAPTFAEVWEELKERLAGKIVVAHNASFDMGVLKASLLANRLQAPDFRTCCTVRIARKVWPGLDDHKLNTVGAHLNINFRHHRALDDARTCAAIPLFAGNGHRRYRRACAENRRKDRPFRRVRQTSTCLLQLCSGSLPIEKRL